MSTHTPGPWCVGHTRVGNTHPSLPKVYETAIHFGGSDNRGNCLAIAYCGGAGALQSDPSSVEANARLIAAAPEMLDALKQIAASAKDATTGEGHAQCWSIACKAIAKATGGAR